MRILLTILLLMPLFGFAEVVTVDFVKVLHGNTEEAVYYYENNWKQHRIEAAKRGLISSHKLLLKTSTDGQTDILLVTSYSAQAQYEKREENFAAVMRDTRGDGPVLLNDKAPGEFRDVVDVGVYSSE